MLGALYQFWFDLIDSLVLSDGSGLFEFGEFTIGGYTGTLTEYFSVFLSFISLIIIVWLCCMFIVKIVKLVGGLIR